MKIKKYILMLLCVAIMLTSLGMRAFAKSADSWYIMRNGSETPKIDNSQKIIYKYNGIYCNENLSKDKKIIYLTFDAGYENGNLAKILDVLAKKKVKASFFILDYLIKKTPELILKMENDGHLVVNHSKNHKDMTTLTEEEIKLNLSALEESYKNLTGKEMKKYFRFPEGRYDERTLSITDKLGYKSVFWSFAYADWDNDKQPEEKYATDLILNNTHNGEILLLHPNSKTNAAILGNLIDKWREMGYEFACIDTI